MADTVFIISTVLFFAASLGFIRLCERLMEDKQP